MSNIISAYISRFNQWHIAFKGLGKENLIVTINVTNSSMMANFN